MDYSHLSEGDFNSPLSCKLLTGRGPGCWARTEGEGLELQEEMNVGVARRQESVRQRVPDAFCEFCCSECSRNLSF